MRENAKILLVGVAVAAAAVLPAIAQAGHGASDDNEPAVPGTLSRPAAKAALDQSSGATLNESQAAPETPEPDIGEAGDRDSDDNEIDVPITGPDLARASEVAINHLDGGTVTGTEIGDEESYYEIEVTLDDGHQVDVQLDESFNVVSTEGDGSSDG